MTARLLIGDVHEALATLPDHSVDTVMTSSPFFVLRSYMPAGHPDKDREIGSEATPSEFIDALLEVTEECRRVLTPYGSLVFELGDSMSGSGGAGGDYDEGGLREGQPRYCAGYSRNDKSSRPQKAPKAARPPLRPLSTRPKYNPRSDHQQDTDLGVTPDRLRLGPKARDNLDGWPLDKSACMIPQLFGVALAYGRNPLTGRETSPWRVRNVVAWCRSNPPVGATGDKFRAATSYLTVAAMATDRYFDGFSVRVATRDGTGTRPLYDYWEIPTQAYGGAHFATFPEALVVPVVNSMCPERVCLSCGAPSRRIVETTNALGAAAGRRSWRSGTDGIGAGHVGAITRSASSAPTAEQVSLGWTHCSCGTGCLPTTWSVDTLEVPQGRSQGGRWVDLEDWAEETPPAETRVKASRRRVVADLGACADRSHWRPGVVLDPFCGSGTTLQVATRLGRDAIGIDLDERNENLVRNRIGLFMGDVTRLARKESAS